MSVTSKLATMGAAGGVAPVEAAAFVGVSSPTNKIYSLNITDPSNITVLDEITVTDPRDFALDHDGRVLYVATGTEKRVRAYDVSDPTAITLLSSAAASTKPENTLDLDPVNNLIFTGTGCVFNVSNPSAITRTKQDAFEFPSVKYLKPDDTAGHGMFLAGSSLATWEVSLTTTDQKGTTAFPVDGPGDAIGVDETNDVFFSLDTAPQVVRALTANASGTSITTQSSYSHATYTNGIKVCDAYPSQLRLYVAERASNKQLLTLSYASSGASLALVSRTSSFNEPAAIDVNPDRVVMGITDYLANTSCVAKIYSLANPNSPVLSGSYTLTTSAGQPNGMPIKIVNYPLA